MTPTRTSDDVASQLRLRIRSGEIPVGSRLPSQRDLAAHLSVGRHAVQEALALLELEGYVETRRGAQGGSFVSEPVAEAAFWRERIRSSLRDLEDVLDFRLGVERQIVLLAADRRRDSDLAAMRAAIEALPGEDADPQRRRAYFREADSLFHTSLAEAAGNARLQRAMRESRAEMFVPTDRIPYVETVEVTRAQHLEIFLAIADRDGDQAARAMSDHVAETRRHLHSLVDEAEVGE